MTGARSWEGVKAFTGECGERWEASKRGKERQRTVSLGLSGQRGTGRDGEACGGDLGGKTKQGQIACVLGEFDLRKYLPREKVCVVSETWLQWTI